jgi:hypothetical protein
MWACVIVEGDLIMNILRDYNSLVGKVIVFSHMARYAEQITLATEDGCVLMARHGFDEDADDGGGESIIVVLTPAEVMRVLNSDRGRFIREQLGMLGIFDMDEYKRQEEEKYRLMREEQKRLDEERELATYKRLKEKYGDM